MKRYLIALVVVLGWFTGAQATWNFGFVDSGGSLQFPLICLDAEGDEVGDADSIHVQVTHEDEAGSDFFLQRRTIVDDSTWQDSTVFAGDTTIFFYDKVADLIEIDATPDPDTMLWGQYNGVITTFFAGGGTPNHFQFYVKREGPDVNVVLVEGVDATTQMDTYGTDATEKVTLVDSSANDIAIMGDHHPTDSITSKAIRDSLQYLVTGGSAGPGAQTLVLYVIDSSGVDAVVSNVTVTIYSSDGTSKIAQGGSNSNGIVLAGATDTLNSTASTAYLAKGFLPGFTIPNYSFTTGSASRYQDTIYCYGDVIGSPSGATLKRVYGYEYEGGGAIEGVVVTATLVYEGNPSGIPTDTSLAVQMGWNWSLSDVTDGNGYWAIDCNLTTNILPVGAKWKIVAKKGSEARWTSEVTLTTTTTDCLNHIADTTQSCP